MTVLITGSRDWSNRRFLIECLMELSDDTTIIEGGASGADECARFAAKALGFKVITVKAEWQKYGKGAGPIRNRQMLDMKPDQVLAFRRNMSSGTTDCLNEAVARGITSHVYDVED